MHKFLIASALAVGSLLVAGGAGSAAPPTTGPGEGNHPYFPLVCDGGTFDQPTPGFVVQANGASAALPTGFFYPGALESGEPDLSVDPILGVAMYREFRATGTDEVLVAQSRGRGITLDKLESRDDIAVCDVPVPFDAGPPLGLVDIRLYVKG